MQLIETSLISAHFVDSTKNAYIDVFSCKPYDVDVAARVCKEAFGAKHVKTKSTVRQ